MGVRVVTDSACDLPQPLVDALGISIVPLTIRFGAEELVDREELTPAGFWERLTTSPVLPETAAPSAGEFEECYRALVERGATAIVSIHMSSRLSATMQSAEVAASALRETCPVEVIDSQTVSLGLGSLCLTAARRAADGDPLAAITAEVVDRRGRTRLFGALDTLEFLKKGGRIGNARALLGSVLSIKPLIEVRGGVVEEAGKVRTRSKALRALVEKVAAQPVEQLSVLHGQATDLDPFLDALSEHVPRDEIVVGEVGPVVGTHAGPGVVGVTFQVARR